MKILKEIAKSTVISIGIAMAVFCIIGIVFDIRYQGSFSMSDYSFTKMVAGCVFIGLGFGVPSVIYERDSIPRPVQILIHMGTGCVIYTVTAFAVGWIGDTASPLKIALIIAGQLALAFLIWICFMVYYRKEARVMNERIKALK